MAKLIWDEITKRLYETGVDRGVVYPVAGGAYPKGEAWNGLISITLSPSGAESTPLYANNSKYLNMLSVEELGGTIEAYTFPESFAACNGLAELAPGVRIGQQARIPFGLTYRTLLGNDTEGTKHGYKLHVIYGAVASPSEDAATTVNDSPEAKTMSWEFNTTPVVVEGHQPTSHIEIDSTNVAPEKLAALEAILYGSEDTEARLPLPDEIVTLIGTEG